MNRKEMSMTEQEFSNDAIVCPEVGAGLRHMPWWYSG